MFVDGFNVIKQIHEKHPEAFDVLKKFYVEFSDYGTDAYGEFSFCYSRPLIGYVSFCRKEIGFYVFYHKTLPYI